MKNILIKNGLVCFEDRIRIADVFIGNGKISLQGFNPDDAEIVDASGCYVLPGMIDIHTHLDDVIGKYYLADTYKTGSEIAIQNGITTLYTFITQGKSESLTDAIERATNKAEGNSFCDYMWHLTPTRFDDENLKQIISNIEKGFKTFKLYTTYESTGIYSSYKKLDEVFKELKNFGLLFLIHCEDNDIINKNGIKKYDIAKPITHVLLRPKSAEIKAIEKITELAKKYYIKLHIVHVSTPEGAELINDSRKDIRISCETAPHYLFLNDEYLKRNDGNRWICSPPLRDVNNMLIMQEKARNGYFDIFATDHCAFLKKDKDNPLRKTHDIRNVPNGIAGIGALPHLTFKIYSDNFKNAVFEVSKRLSENPAKITGIYPRKGVIKEGSDADLVVLNPEGEERNIISSLSDVYETYPGFKTKLSFKYVFIGGELAVENDKLVKEKATGKCLI